MVLIATAIGAAIKFFGSRRDDADDEAQGDDPIVRTLFAAMNSGDFSKVADVVADECEVYANGYRLSVGSIDRGPELIAAVMRSFHEELEDVRWELYDELRDKDDRVHKLAMRMVSSATVDGQYHEIEVAVFARIEDKKLVEWREVLDMTLANERRAASGLPLID